MAPARPRPKRPKAVHFPGRRRRLGAMEGPLFDFRLGGAVGQGEAPSTPTLAGWARIGDRHHREGRPRAGEGCCKQCHALVSSFGGGEHSYSISCVDSAIWSFGGRDGWADFEEATPQLLTRSAVGDASEHLPEMDWYQTQCARSSMDGIWKWGTGDVQHSGGGHDRLTELFSSGACPQECTQDGDTMRQTPPEFLLGGGEPLLPSPSGPRQSGEGVGDEIQGVVASEWLPSGGIQLSLTLLVAGFIIGPSGSCIRDIIQASGADIVSTTRQQKDTNKMIRVFRIEGPPAAILSSLLIILAAVRRYKYLAEGECSGHEVDWCQTVAGVQFYYQPPPRSIVPHAAAIKMPRMR
eukprot:evm.model.scf_2446.2 EVM.evm.TU.scf_2446.2   scf_2446:12334-19994(+)